MLALKAWAFWRIAGVYYYVYGVCVGGGGEGVLFGPPQFSNWLQIKADHFACKQLWPWRKTRFSKINPNLALSEGTMGCTIKSNYPLPGSNSRDLHTRASNCKRTKNEKFLNVQV